MYLTVYQNCHTQIFLKYRGTRKSAISSFTDILQIRPTHPHTFDKQAYPLCEAPSGLSKKSSWR